MTDRELGQGLARLQEATKEDTDTTDTGTATTSMAGVPTVTGVVTGVEEGVVTRVERVETGVASGPLAVDETRTVDGSGDDAVVDSVESVVANESILSPIRQPAPRPSPDPRASISPGSGSSPSSRASISPGSSPGPSALIPAWTSLSQLRDQLPSLPLDALPATLWMCHRWSIDDDTTSLYI